MREQSIWPPEPGHEKPVATAATPADLEVTGWTSPPYAGSPWGPPPGAPTHGWSGYSGYPGGPPLSAQPRRRWRWYWVVAAAVVGVVSVLVALLVLVPDPTLEDTRVVYMESFTGGPGEFREWTDGRSSGDHRDGAFWITTSEKGLFSEASVGMEETDVVDITATVELQAGAADQDIAGLLTYNDDDEAYLLAVTRSGEVSILRGTEDKLLTAATGSAPAATGPTTLRLTVESTMEETEVVGYVGGAAAVEFNEDYGFYGFKVAGAYAEPATGEPTSVRVDDVVLRAVPW